MAVASSRERPKVLNSTMFYTFKKARETLSDATIRSLENIWKILLLFGIL